MPLMHYVTAKKINQVKPSCTDFIDMYFYFIRIYLLSK